MIRIIHEARRQPNGTLSRTEENDEISSNRYNRRNTRKKTVTLGIFGDGHVPAKLFYAQVERTNRYVAVARLRVQADGGRPHQHPNYIDNLHSAVIEQTNLTNEQIIEYLHDGQYVYIVYNLTA